MKRVLLDTNFLVDLCRFRIDVRELEEAVGGSFELCTLDTVIVELKRLNTKEAKAALKLMEIGNIKILKSEVANTDNALAGLAGEDVIVATDDRELRERLKAVGRKTIYIRARKHLAME